MTLERWTNIAFKQAFNNIGVSTEMTMDGSKDKFKGETIFFYEQAGCTIIDLEKDAPLSNRVEQAIYTMKNATKRGITATESLLILWCL